MVSCICWFTPPGSCNSHSQDPGALSGFPMCGLSAVFLGHVSSNLDQSRVTPAPPGKCVRTPCLSCRQGLTHCVMKLALMNVFHNPVFVIYYSIFLSELTTQEFLGFITNLHRSRCNELNVCQLEMLEFVTRPVLHTICSVVLKFNCIVSISQLYKP